MNLIRFPVTGWYGFGTCSEARLTVPFDAMESLRQLSNKLSEKAWLV